MSVVVAGPGRVFEKTYVSDLADKGSVTKTGVKRSRGSLEREVE